MARTKRQRIGDYACVPSCGQSFDSFRGLSRHQYSCQANAKSLNNDLTEAVASREKAKRARIGNRDDAIALSVNEKETSEPEIAKVTATMSTAAETTAIMNNCVSDVIPIHLASNHALQLNSSDMDMNDHIVDSLDDVSSMPTRQDTPPPRPIASHESQVDLLDEMTTSESLAETVPTSPGQNTQEDESLGRGKRKKIPVQRYIVQNNRRRKPFRYNDPKPDAPPPLPDEELYTQMELQNMSSEAPVPISSICETERNFYGLFRQYFSRPSYVPDEASAVYTVDAPEPCLRGLANSSPESNIASASVISEDNNLTSDQSSGDYQSWFWPFLNASAFRIMNWFWSGSQHKSVADLQTLIEKVLTADDFQLGDLQNFSVRRESQRLDSAQEQASLLGISDIQDSWKTVDVAISLPDRCPRESEADAPTFTISGLYYRSIVEVIRAAFKSPDALRYHYMPFKQFWSATLQPFSSLSAEQRYRRTVTPEESIALTAVGEATPQRIYDELYSSDTWYEEHSKIQAQRRADDLYENAIAGMMLWSDSTHLADFGNASLWPIYLFFGNQSKYERCRPSAHACHHIAYLPELPDSISEAFRKQSAEGKKPSGEALTHCKRDLLQVLLKVIFDEEFTKAYREGIVIECADGITRRIFPRIFTWSADYPEKVMLATIRYLSDCPCPRCLVPRREGHALGTKRNNSAIDTLVRKDTEERQSKVRTAREIIYKLGRGVKSAAVALILFAQSMVPIINTLSALLYSFGANFYSLFVVDLLHEFELGVWKTTFIQLVQIVSDGVPDGLSKLNERYRAIPTFGGDTIRKFSTDASSMTKLGARDFEDLLTCAIPAFEGLLPGEHNEVVLDLLFCLSTWHALAKLRMHTDATVGLLENATTLLGEKLRLFKEKTCVAFETEELKVTRIAAEKLQAARKKGKGPVKRRKPRGNKANGTNGEEKSKKRKEVKKRKVYNLDNFKTHSLGHYTRDIKRFGSVDSYSTQSGELEHKQVKKFYQRTNKNNATRQMAFIERRNYIVRSIAKRDPYALPNTMTVVPDADAVPFTQSDKHHHISLSRSEYIYLPAWLRKHDGDPATNDFRNKLKDHLLRRLLDDDFDGDEEEYSEEQRNTLQIEYDRLYIHKVLRVNHTTYDLRRSQDSMNPRTHADIMVLAPRVVRKGVHPEDEDENYEDEGHPFWYARIINIFHANIRHAGPRSKTGGAPTKMEFLLVRWYGQASEMPSGWSVKRLLAVKFVPKWDAGAFGFIDPSQVVRGAHLIPAFHHGKALARLANSVACKENEEEWECYYVNSFVDRDMFMRYAGGGVGHMRIELATKLQALRTEDLQPEHEGTFQGSGSAAQDGTAVPYSVEAMATMLVDEELDEVLSAHEDGGDGNSSSSEGGD